MLDLLKSELEINSEILNKGMLAIENNNSDASLLSDIIRGAHSIKGAAKILGFDSLAGLAGACEDRLNDVKDGNLKIEQPLVELIINAVEIFNKIAIVKADEIPTSIEKNNDDIILFTNNLKNFDKKSETHESIVVEKPKPEVTQEAPKIKVENKKEDHKEEPIDPMMLELFITEMENNSTLLNDGLLNLEKNPKELSNIEELMRASHSIKGAARILNITAIVKIAHLMEDYFISVKETQKTPTSTQIDLLLSSVDLFAAIAAYKDVNKWISENNEQINALEIQLSKIKELEGKSKPEVTPKVIAKPEKIVEDSKPSTKSVVENNVHNENKGEEGTRILRISTDIINKMIGFASESLITAQNIQKDIEDFSKIRKIQNELWFTFERYLEFKQKNEIDEKEQTYLSKIQHEMLEYKKQVLEYNMELEIQATKSYNISNRLYKEVLQSRMRPFEDGVNDFPRMVRDISKQLNKKVEFEIRGKNTKVDRDILEKLKSPLTHILRNAIDHGLELPNQRISKNKTEEGKIILTAMHSGGMLLITIEDDGKGIDFEKLKTKIVDKNYITQDIADSLSPTELTDFLFLPGFSTAEQVTEVSGRGVGLDVVQNMIQEVGGTINVETQLGQGTKFILKLPITLSVLRTLIVWVADEPYAFPLTRIEQTLIVEQDEIHSVEGKQYFRQGDNNIGLVHLSQVLGKPEKIKPSEKVNIVVIGDRINKYALVVDRFVGEQDLVIHKIDSRLGKIKDISSASVLGNGDPVLIFDVEDLIRSIDDIITGGRLKRIARSIKADISKKKRILVVDDSITVREVEKKLLINAGYEVDTAINGVDGWNLVREHEYNLVISDIDMPRMNGFEFVSLIKENEKLKNIPVIIVSYKDRQEDKLKGLEVGANYYLTKSSFNDDSFINAVKDLIGESDK